MREVNLPLAGRVPGGVQQEEVVGSSEVQTHATGLGREKSVRESGERERELTLRLSSITLGLFFPLLWKTFTASARSECDIVLSNEMKIKIFQQSRYLPVETNVGEALFPDERLDDGEVGGELRHHHDLVPGVLLADPHHLLDGGLDLAAGAVHLDIL